MCNNLLEFELRKLFAPYDYYKELGGSETIFRPFICMRGPKDVAVPNRDYSSFLRDSGLAHKLVPFDTRNTIGQLRNELCFHLPKLNLVPFDFMKSCSSAPGDMLSSIPVHSEEELAVKLFTTRNQILYIRPLDLLN